jgi:hypothetical protein
VFVLIAALFIVRPAGLFKVSTAERGVTDPIGFV